MTPTLTQLFVQLGLCRFYYSHVRIDRENEFTPERKDVLVFWIETYKRYPATVALLADLVAQVIKDSGDAAERNWHISSIHALHERLVSIQKKAAKANSFEELDVAIALDSIWIEGTCATWQKHIVETNPSVTQTLGLPCFPPEAKNKTSGMQSAKSLEKMREALSEKSDELETCMRSRELVNELLFWSLVDAKGVFLHHVDACKTELQTALDRLEQGRRKNTSTHESEEISNSIARLKERVHMVALYTQLQAPDHDPEKAVWEEALRYEEELQMLLHA